MPNHVINILSFEGDKTKIRQMLEDIKDDEYTQSLRFFH